MNQAGRLVSVAFAALRLWNVLCNYYRLYRPPDAKRIDGGLWTFAASCGNREASRPTSTTSKTSRSRQANTIAAAPLPQVPRCCVSFPLRLWHNREGQGNTERQWAKTVTPEKRQAMNQAGRLVSVAFAALRLWNVLCNYYRLYRPPDAKRIDGGLWTFAASCGNREASRPTSTTSQPAEIKP